MFEIKTQNKIKNMILIHRIESEYKNYTE